MGLPSPGIFSTPPSKTWRQILDQSIEDAKEALIAAQAPEGYWSYHLEADTTIPSEYIMMMHFMDEIDDLLQQKFAVYIRSKQNNQGGWPLFYGGKSNISCTVKAYYALKLAGDSVSAPHMVSAREQVLSMGGAARSNVFTRIQPF